MPQAELTYTTSFVAADARMGVSMFSRFSSLWHLDCLRLTRDGFVLSDCMRSL